MRKDYSVPAVSLPSNRWAPFIYQSEAEEENTVDYSHLDIIAEVERIIERRLIRHTRTSGKWHCACPFPDCTSKNDAFIVWDRPVLEERCDGRHEVHFWCGRCGRTGSLIALLRQYREATTGEQITWSEAARALRIDPRTKQANEGSKQGRPHQASIREQRHQQDEQRRKAAQSELATLDALYRRARGWLAAGQVTMKDGCLVSLDHARAYLLARGYSLEQASRLGMAYVPTVQEIPEMSQMITSSWRGRILFPLSGPDGARGYAGRTLWRWMPGMTTEQHKRILDTWNTCHPEKRISRHYKTARPAFYGYEEACQAFILIIVEGEFDAASIRLALDDMPDMAVCAFGKNVSARLVPANVLHVVLALDHDQAGQQAVEPLVAELQACGMTVSVALPPAGKDWNDCHLLAGLEAIRVEIARACDASSAGVLASEYPSSLRDAIAEQPIHLLPKASPVRPIEPPGYENGMICLLCGKQIKDTDGAFYLCEDRASTFWGDLFCMPCWKHQSQPEESQQRGISNDLTRDIGEQVPQNDQGRATFFAQVHQVLEGWPEPHTLLEEEEENKPGNLENEPDDQGSQFTETSGRCQKHHRPLRYSDERGGRYCDHVDCWERYRLMRYGARNGYPTLSGIIDPRDYLADTSKPPLHLTDSGQSIYPARPPVSQQLISAGAGAWSTYAAGRDCQDIDQAIRALKARTIA